MRCLATAPKNKQMKKENQCYLLSAHNKRQILDTFVFNIN